jgi:CBS domain-containing protein
MKQRKANMENLMNVENLCQRNVVTIREADELSKAAQLMREHHIGYLVVVKPEVGDGSLTPVGVLTDRDIVIKVVAREVSPRALRVDDVMSRKPVLANETDSLNKALREMRRIGVRRLPVVGGRGQLVGVLSLDNVLDALAEELSDVAGSIRNEQRIEGALQQ